MSCWINSARAATLALAPLISAAAFAHAHLESASPPAGGTVTPPQEIRLTFSEALETKFSSVTLTGPGGAIPTEKPAAAGDGHTLILKLSRPLAPGVYNVNWRAISTDAHKTQGAFGFTVK